MGKIEIFIREATKTDVPRIVEMLADDVLGQAREQSTPQLSGVYVQAFSDIDRDPNATILLACSEERVVGCMQINILANLSRTGSKRGQIEGVRVDSAMRGQGVGAFLMDAAIAYCKQNGCSLMQLTTDAERPDAAKFYDTYGFVASHVGYKLTL